MNSNKRNRRPVEQKKNTQIKIYKIIKQKGQRLLLKMLIEFIYFIEES